MCHPLPRRRRSFTTLAAAAAVMMAGAAQATVLTFDVASISGVNANYGDRVSSFGADYGSAGGATPNIVVDFVTDSGRPFSIYSAGYATLLNALGHGNYDEPGHVQLTPDAGFDVVLSSFQLAGWSAGSYANSRIRVVDTAGTTYLDTGLFTFAPSTVLTYPGSSIRSSLPLRIVVDDFGDLGLDNVVFSQVSSVPEAPPLAMLAAGLAVLGLVSRRRAGPR